jgi:hypothetical protein
MWVEALLDGPQAHNHLLDVPFVVAQQLDVLHVVDLGPQLLLDLPKVLIAFAHY